MGRLALKATPESAECAEDEMMPRVLGVLRGYPFELRRYRSMSVPNVWP